MNRREQIDSIRNWLKSCREEVRIGKKLSIDTFNQVMDEDGRIGWISRIYPYNTPSENCMKLTLGFVILFKMEKEGGTRDNCEVYVHGLPIKL